MTVWSLLYRNLRFHARSHLGVLLGAVIGSTVLVGALVVGDSVRGSLTQAALSRLGNIHFALNTPDRLFRTDLRERIAAVQARPNPSAAVSSSLAQSFPTKPLASALLLPGMVTRQDGSARANRVNVIGVESPAWQVMAGWTAPGPGASDETVCVNEALAQQLHLRPGDELVARVRKPSTLGLDAALSPRNEDHVALRLKVGAIIPRERLGNFGLSSQPVPPANLFLPLSLLAGRTGNAGRANLLVFGPETGAGDASKADRLALAPLSAELERSWRLEDANLVVRAVQPGQVEISSERIFLEPVVVAAARQARSTCLSNHLGFERDTAEALAACQFVSNGVRVLTYLANQLRAGERTTPYSMVSAADPPYVPADMGTNEILVNEWLAEDLQVKPGDRVELSYYVVDSGSQLLERTNVFYVRNILPINGLHADRTLMPEFPGVAKAESTHDWDTGFPLVHRLRDKDEAYWKEHRGTPKAFISLAAGQALWSNRFGNVTSIRYLATAGTPISTLQSNVYANLLANLGPADVGLRLEPVREQALHGAAQAQDFGQLFLGFSFFLMTAALLLMGLLFQFSLEQRAAEVGTFLALGFGAGQVRRWLLMEGSVLGAVGGLVGIFGGIGYAQAMLWGLATAWRDAIGRSTLGFHVASSTVVLGSLAGTIVAVFTIWLTLRKQARQPVPALLAGEVRESAGAPGRWAISVAMGSGAGGVGIIAWTLVRGDTANAGAFFGAGSFLLVAGLAGFSAWLHRLARQGDRSGLSLRSLGIRGCARRHSRSLATIALLSCGSFLIVAIGAFRLDAERDASRRTSGTGGFALLGETTLPVVQNLNTPAGREFFGMSASDLSGVKVVPFRVRSGDEASCLNLNRAQKPRLLGVNPDLLAGRFSFAGVARGLDAGQGWALLKSEASPDTVPAIGDANSIQWALGKKLGDTVEYTDEQGRSLKLRLVAGVANSLLQGCLVIDEAAFVRHFPNEGGYRMFLMDVPSTGASQTSATLTRALQDVGIELIITQRRVNEYNAVQNTYLGTFQVLGGLGLLLGSAGLGVVVLRNVFERRGELALLTAVGFRRSTLVRLVLMEHGALLGLGLALGLASAAVAVLPALLSSANELPWRSLLATLGGVLVNGAIWIWLATRTALRGQLLVALRNE